MLSQLSLSLPIVLTRISISNQPKKKRISQGSTTGFWLLCKLLVRLLILPLVGQTGSRQRWEVLRHSEQSKQTDHLDAACTDVLWLAHQVAETSARLFICSCNCLPPDHRRKTSSQSGRKCWLPFTTGWNLELGALPTGA